MKITLVNNKGEQIAMIYNDFISNEDIISYDVRTLASAVYYIKLETNSGYDLVPISIRK